MDVSICITTYKESKSLDRLLSRLFLILKKNSFEIIIVDSCSEDKTWEIVSKYVKRNRNIVFISQKCSIAEGRNIAIKKAKGKNIVLTDAGCYPKKDWLSKITKPFNDKKVNIVAGYYRMSGRTSFQRALAPFFGVLPSKYKSGTFLPSARSLAFRKTVWKKVGGFNEKLSKAGEDTLFNHRLLTMGYHFTNIKKAIVYWKLPNNLVEAFIKQYYYAKGDAETKIWTYSKLYGMSHNVKILTIYIRYLCLLILIVLNNYKIDTINIMCTFICLYLFWSIWKVKDVVRGWKQRVWIPLIQIVSDIAVMSGFASGLASMIAKKYIYKVKIS